MPIDHQEREGGYYDTAEILRGWRIEIVTLGNEIPLDHGPSVALGACCGKGDRVILTT
jgi:hypothetical protein